jgi:hypothetical protein
VVDEPLKTRFILCGITLILSLKGFRNRLDGAFLHRKRELGLGFGTLKIFSFSANDEEDELLLLLLELSLLSLFYSKLRSLMMLRDDEGLGMFGLTPLRCGKSSVKDIKSSKDCPEFRKSFLG